MKNSKTLEEVLDKIREAILLKRQLGHITRIAIDGVDGSGKSMFAKALAQNLKKRSVPIIRASIDGFHRPRAERYRRGRHDPEGFYRDSYDYPALKALLLDPLSPGGNKKFVTAIHDATTDESINQRPQLAPTDAILVLDGIFLQRDELAEYWDYSIFLDVDFAVTFPRMAKRDGTSPNPHNKSNRRYLEGQLIYIQECKPKNRASIVIDNNDFLKPHIS